MKEIEFEEGEIKTKRLQIDEIEPGLAARLYLKLQEEGPIKIMVPRELSGSLKVELDNNAPLNLGLIIETHAQNDYQIPATIDYNQTKFDHNNGGLSSPVNKPPAKTLPYKSVAYSRRVSCWGARR